MSRSNMFFAFKIVVCLMAVVVFSEAADQYCTTCRERRTQCTVTPQIDNGEAVNITDASGAGALKFHCKPGYVIMGARVLSCCNGFWNAQVPKCVARDCKAHRDSGNTNSGSYLISPNGTCEILVHCDMTTAGGGWTVIQRRVDNSTNFNRNWQDYKEGFGQHDHNYWMGLDSIHELTEPDNEVYMYMKAGPTESAFSRYSLFKVANELDKYRLTMQGYQATSTAGDCTHYAGGRVADGHAFSTADRDNDVHPTLNCASLYPGGWWFTRCFLANPNGRYLDGAHPGFYAGGINYRSYKGYYYSLKYFEIKVRRK